MTKFYDSDSEARWWAGIVGRILLGLAIFAVLAVIVTGGTLAWRWAFAGPSGTVQKQEIIQSGVNQLGQQAEFERLFGDIRAYDQQIGQTSRALAANPSDSRLQTILLGLQNQCASATQQYNALAQTERAEAFRSANLPAVIDGSDPTTDCKGST